jgi:5-methylcytosine-specific restriction endonuclease McrA
MSLDPVDSPIELVEAAARALVAGDEEAARTHLGPIAGITAARRPPLPLPAPKLAWRAATAKRSDAGDALKYRVYRRDSFTCVYCERPTIHSVALELVSLVLPEELPRGSRNWPKASTHFVYWDISSACDHMHPSAHEGSSDFDNLVTAFARCNDQKSSYWIEDLNWTATRTRSEWDGLMALVPDLYERAGRPATARMRTWINLARV